MGQAGHREHGPSLARRALVVVALPFALTLALVLPAGSAAAQQNELVPLEIGKIFFTEPQGQTATVPITFEITSTDPGCTAFASVELPAGDTTVSVMVEAFDIVADPCNYTVTELGGSGWTADDAVQLADFQGGEGGNRFTVFFANAENGEIRIDKTVIGPAPADDWEFRVTSTAASDPRCATDLVVTVPPSGGSNMVSVPDLSFFEAACFYDVEETVKIGWTPDPNPAIYTDLPPDSTAAFTNTAQPATLIVIEDTVPDDPTDFSYTLSDGVAVALAFTLDDDTDGALSNSRTEPGLDPGNYTIQQDADPNYSTSLSCDDGTSGVLSATVTLGAGATVRCTFTNTLRLGGITVIKEVFPGSTDVFEFVGDLGVFSLADGNSFDRSDLASGDYTITETLVAGYETSVSCDDGTTSSSNEVTVSLPPGANVVCTFTNTQPAGSVTVIVESDPRDGTDFDFTTGGLDPAGFMLDDDDDPTLDDRIVFSDSATAPITATTRLAPGAYVVAQAAQAGWTTTVVCIDPTGDTVVTGLDAAIELAAGEDVVCTFTNAAVATPTPEPTAEPTPTPEPTPEPTATPEPTPGRPAQIPIAPQTPTPTPSASPTPTVDSAPGPAPTSAPPGLVATGSDGGPTMVGLLLLGLGTFAVAVARPWRGRDD